MQVELLHFADCPNWQLTDGRLRDALTRAGRDDVRVEHRQVTTPEQAQSTGFRGSPTVLWTGDPFADPDAPVGLSCRVHRTDATPAGAPTVERLFAVLS